MPVLFNIVLQVESADNKWTVIFADKGIMGLIGVANTKKNTSESPQVKQPKEKLCTRLSICLGYKSQTKTLMHLHVIESA